MGGNDDSSAFRKPRHLGESYGTFEDGSGSSVDTHSASVGSGLVGSSIQSADFGISPRMPWPSSNRQNRAPSWMDEHSHIAPIPPQNPIPKAPSDSSASKASTSGFSSDYYNQDGVVPVRKAPIPVRKSPMVSPLVRDYQGSSMPPLNLPSSFGVPPARTANGGQPLVSGIAAVERASVVPQLPPRTVNGHDILSDIVASYSKPEIVVQAAQSPPPLPMRSPLRVTEPAVRSTRALSDPIPPPLLMHVPVPRAIPLHMRNHGGGVRSSFSSVESSRSHDEHPDGSASSFSSSPSIAPPPHLESRSNSDRVLGAGEEGEAGGDGGEGSAPPPPPLTSSAIKKHWSRQYFTETSEYE